MAGRTEKVRHIIQGEHCVSDAPDEVISTILGSCVAACIYDPLSRIGGANHFLLSDPGNGPVDIRYAAAAMEVLVNSLLRRGAQKRRLEAKLFGGARIMRNLPDIGGANAKAAEKFLRDEGIPVISSDLGGEQARRMRFWPTTGRVQIQRLAPQNALPAEAPRPRQTSNFELFDGADG